MKQSVTYDQTVIDFGAHFWPEELDDIEGYTHEPSAAATLEGMDRRRDPETVFAEMEEAGVDANVVSIPDLMGETDYDATVESNDLLWDYVDEYDEFYGLASIPLHGDGEESAQEFERAIDMGYNGGGLHETNIELTDDEMEPVLEVADQTGAPLFIHILNLPGDDYQLGAAFGREYGHKESIAKAIHQDLFGRYPNLTVVWHHLGGNIASHLGRVHLRLDSGRWPAQEKCKSWEEFKADLEENVYIDTSGYFGYDGPIRTALEEFPASQILFGSDYPAEPRSGEEFGELVDSIRRSTSEENAAKILGENALDVMVNVD